MEIAILTPAARGSRTGNRITALRWARILRGLGHRVRVSRDRPGNADVVVAIHATKSHAAIVRARVGHGDRPLLVLLAGTDLYVDLAHDPSTQESLRLATRILVLHDRAAAALPAELRAKVRVMLQSATPPPTRRPRDDDRFVVVVIGHLREIKDPFLSVRAAQALPDASRIVIRQIGGALDDTLAHAAREFERSQPRYRWLGLLSRRATLEQLASADLLVLSSRAEGGANVISEALACDVPVLATAIDASRALLGDDHPGLFAVGDVAALTALLLRAERDAAFRAELARHGARRRALFAPAREQAAWRALLAEVVPTG